MFTQHQTLCRVSSGQRGHHQPAEVGQNQTGDPGGSLRLLRPHQTPAGPAERQSVHRQQQKHRGRVRETHGRGETRKIYSRVSAGIIDWKTQWGVKKQRIISFTLQPYLQIFWSSWSSINKCLCDCLIYANVSNVLHQCHLLCLKLIKVTSS